jgi:hypothetical protein
MAFCNSCGATLAPGAKFCNNCGTTILASGTVPAATTSPVGSSTAPVAPTSPARKDTSALKIILIAVGIIVCLGILGTAAIGFIGWHIARNSHVHQEGDTVKIDTPFGAIESSKDPQEAVRNLDVDLYPGSQVLKDGATTTTMGGIHTVTANFETGDSVHKVSDFYKSQFPNAMVTTSEADHCTIVSNDSKKLVTINIVAEGGRTKILISNVTHRSGAAAPSKN